MRGYLFELSTDSNDLEKTSANEMAGMWPGEASWYDDLSEEEKLRILQDPKQYGDSSHPKQIFFCEEDGTWVARITQADKEEYFADMFRELKEAVQKMTLEKFATSGSLGLLIGDDWGDAVLVDGSDFMTFDYFIRTADDQPYYLSDILLMH